MVQLNMALIAIFAFLCMFSYPSSSASNLQTYVVHLEPSHLPSSNQVEVVETLYQSFLEEVLSSSPDLTHPSSRLVYSYKHVATGFAARLTPEEVKAMEKKQGFVMASPERMLPLHTTHSPSFLGLQQDSGFWKDSNFGEGVIIGVLDTGIKPDHLSFNDDGMLAPPDKWQGTCELGAANCNNKLIGVRNFASGETAIDNNGHGTHTAGTTAGNFVEGANMFGNANGTAVGVAPRAHLAIYKVCTSKGCSDAAILAAMDAAVGDGVDILSLSLGAPSRPFFLDNIAIGAFGAIKRGIFVSCSAGNSGPSSQTVSNAAPWILTVGASSMDRIIRATTELGSGEELNGQTLNQTQDLAGNMLPLVFPGINGDTISASCGPNAFANNNVRGKIVLCLVGNVDLIVIGQRVKDAGGAGMIVMNVESQGYSIMAQAHVLPATHVSFADGLKIINYIKSVSNPTATISFQGTIIEPDNAPMVSYFSSRGPSKVSPGILKPDIIGPGVNILAAWPFSVDGQMNAASAFNIISGTSMSCPHLSGVVALLKNAHPDWSPAAIKSAIMTTAYQLNLMNQAIVDQRLLPADLFATGAGHVNPSKATDPGLVYDIQPQDYIPYLCGLGYRSQLVSIVTRQTVDCSTVTTVAQAQLNYPSFAITLGSADQTYTRTVTNVGEAISSYTVQVDLPAYVRATVTPNTLDFSEMNEQMIYRVTFTTMSTTVGTSFIQGSLSWISDAHVVRIPVAISLV